jgi:DnaJ-class molecular chaperone
MIKAHSLGHLDSPDLYTQERNKVLCPECGGEMADTSTACNSCQARRRADTLAQKRREVEIPAMLERHRLFTMALEAGYTIRELVKMGTSLPVEGRDYCRI